MRKHLLAGLGLLAASILIAGSAQATPILVTIDATVTRDDTGAVGVGSSLFLNVTLDDSTPNETTAPNYLATGNPGTLDTIVFETVLGTVFDVTGTGSNTWIMNGELELLGTVPITVTITGTGMTPGQILPDFDPAVAGELSVDVGALGLVTAAVDSVSIVPVPEPSTALLLALGLAGLGVARRRIP